MFTTKAIFGSLFVLVVIAFTLASVGQVLASTVSLEWGGKNTPIPTNPPEPTFKPVTTKSPIQTFTSLHLETKAVIQANDVNTLAVTYYVIASGGSDSNDCLSSGAACATINGAIGKAAISGDTIKVATGTFIGTGTEVVLINKSVMLSGGWNAGFTTQSGTSTIDGQIARRGITIDNGATATVEHFTVQNGSAISGGGIFNSGNLTLNTSIVSNNTTTSATYGGGIYNSGILIVNFSTIKDNIGDYQGGGIANSNTGNIVLTNSTVSNNNISYYSGEGGGINNGGILALNNSTISSNTAPGGRGGGLANYGAATVNNSTITGNNTAAGGGISNIYGLDIVLRNSIIAENTAVSGPDCYDNSDFAGSISSAGYNLIGNSTNCAFTSSIGDLTDVEANLAPLSDNGGGTFTHALYSFSTAINTGNPAPPGNGGNACFATDQRGVSRPQGAHCDIGAYESATYTLTYTAGAHGSISGTSPQTVNYGGSGSAVTAVPATGYHFVNWSDLSTANPRTDTNVIANISVTANFALNRSTIADFNGDGTTDVSIFRPSNGVWYVKDQFAQQYGGASDIPVPGDYNGDGQTDVAVFRPSNGVWYLSGGTSVQYGGAGDIPVPGDYDGNGTTDVAVFRPSNGVWYIRGGTPVQYGGAGDIPVPGDYDGNGTTDVAVFRPSNGVWYLKDQSAVQYGGAGDIPVPGDYDGNGTTDKAVFRPSSGIWYIFGGTSVQYGGAGDIPAPGDYDGNGTTDIAVFRPSNGVWYVNGQFSAQYGGAGDFPCLTRDTNGDGDPYQDLNQ